MPTTDSDPTLTLGSSECAHCGLPVPNYRQQSVPSFCCNGCESVYAILHQNALGESYYRLRRSASALPTGKRPLSSANEPLMLELDSEVFAEKHTTTSSDGYVRTQLFVDGVHCAACVWLIEQLPKELNGIRFAQLNLPKGRLSLEWNPDTVQLSAIARWLNKYGYGVLPRIEGVEAPETREERRLLIRMGICWALAGNIMLLAFAEYAGLDRDTTHLFEASRWVSLALTIPVIVIGGSVFFQKAFQSLLLSFRQRSVRNLHMDLPISLGILVGFVSSAWSTAMGPGDVWFDSISILIAALLTARWLQLRARRKAGNSTEQLLAILPTMARRRDVSGAWAAIRTDSLASNDVVMVKPGELIPVDGVVLTGSSLINASVLTGESLPIRKVPGQLVFAGTTNETDEIQIQVSSIGSHTSVGKLLSWVTNDFENSHTTVNWTTVVGGWFTITVLSLAFASACYWWWVEPSRMAPIVVSLLVITCPCALGMAAPLALAVGSGRAAKMGVFIKKDAVFEWLKAASTVVLDKTGTLTSGSMTITEIIGTGTDAEVERIMRAAAALEANSIHPIGRAFHRWSDGRVLPKVRNVAHVPSQGIEGFISRESLDETVDGGATTGARKDATIRIGSLQWISLQSSVLQAHAERLIGSGHIVIGIELEGRAVCVVAIADPLRPKAHSLVQLIKESGKQVILCTGDSQDTASIVGGVVGIEPQNCLGNQSPTMKKELIATLIAQGQIVAMIGDGVNDSGALQSAHVGIAVTEGTAASRFAADAFTTRSGLDAIMVLLQDSPKVIRVINRNLVFSLGYNMVGASLAFMGLISPLVAAIAMPISSLIVVSSSIAQKTFVERPTSP